MHFHEHPVDQPDLQIDHKISSFIQSSMIQSLLKSDLLLLQILSTSSYFFL